MSSRTLERTTARLRRVPLVAKLRHVAERAFAPYLRADVQRLEDRQAQLENDLGELRQAVGDIERHIGPLLRSISTTNGTAQLIRQEIDSLRELVARQEAARPDAGDPT